MSKIQLVCDEHPKYKTIYPPKVDCLICWKIYALKLRTKLKELKGKNNG